MALDETHDPALASFVASANDPGGDFPIQNLPLGAFSESPGGAGAPRRRDRRSGARPRALPGGRDCSATTRVTAQGVPAPTLNALMALGPARVAPSCGRRRAAGCARAERRSGRRRRAPARAAVPRSHAALPAAIGDYTDFYASIFHATNVGSMFRPDKPLLPNYKYVPIGYHGRASSIVPSGTPVRRPSGQIEAGAAIRRRRSGRADASTTSSRSACSLAQATRSASPLPIGERRGSTSSALCLLNDWSARDIQAWEYQPLGPFLAKNFATTVSPWVVTLDALAPFRVPVARRPAGDPRRCRISTHRGCATPRRDRRAARGVASHGADARGSARPPAVVSRSNLRHLYWTVAQLRDAPREQRLQPASRRSARRRARCRGPTRESRGCLLELTWRGTEPLAAAERRDAALPRGRRRGDLPRLVRAGRRRPDRLRRVPRRGHPRARADLMRASAGPDVRTPRTSCVAPKLDRVLGAVRAELLDHLVVEPEDEECRRPPSDEVADLSVTRELQGRRVHVPSLNSPLWMLSC